MFKRRIHQHKILVTYVSGNTRKKYEGMDAKAAEQAFNEAREKWREPFTNISSVEWNRDGDTHKVL